MIDLHLGDCLEVMKQIPDKSVDLVLTDIPYGEVNRKSNGLRNLNKGLADIVTFDIESVLNECFRVSKGSIYIFCGTNQVGLIRQFFNDKNLTTRLCIWEKTNPSPMNGQYIWLSSIECCVYARHKNATFNEHCKSSVWRFSIARGKLHPTMKPLKLMEYLIETSSNQNDTVLDFTMGSGTTGVACKNLNRKFIGIEQDPTYFQIAKERINGSA
jgi:DNA modification methylase